MTDCPTPGRIAYQSEGRAWAALRGLGHQLPYRCSCGQWHTAAAAEARAKREAGRP